ncbi:PfkB family carbohydrate kinase [Glaciibacter sp. 2TAF33]|uniref:PfkB family carbohydrate kinase n=1 Tax=Glaciibacter sp. 2TAF33 TaxID=3233015 RepID=UPI003F933495
MSFTVGVSGGLSVDHLVVAPTGARFNQLGGPGLYAALGARLVDGAAVRLSADVPRDDPRFDQLFTELGIDHTQCAYVGSASRLWILNSDQGRRIVFTSAQGNVELETEESTVESFDFASVPAAFYRGLDGLLESSPDRLPPTEATTIVGIDPHQLRVLSGGLDYLREVSPERAVILPSRVQLTLIDNDPKAAARTIATTLGSPVVARLDREGMYVVSEDGTWSVHDNDVTVYETTGAGDSSAAAIIAALSGGADLVTAAMLGVSVARLAVADWGHLVLSGATPLINPFNGITATKELK